MANKSVLQFNEATAISGPNYLHLVVGNVDKKIQWANVVDQIDTDLAISTTFDDIYTSLSSKGTVNSIATGTGLTGGTITNSGTISLANTSVTPGSYSNASITVDAQGRITSASNGAGGSTGDISSASNLTTNKYPVITGSKQIGDGRIFQDANTLTVPSPNGLTYFSVGNKRLKLYQPTDTGAIQFVTSDNDLQIVYSDSAGAGRLALNNSYTEVFHTLGVSLNAPSVILNQLTADTVPYLNSSKAFQSSSVTPTELGRIAGLTSNAQTQLNSKGTVNSITAGSGLSGGTITNSGTISIATGGVTDAMLSSTFLKADGTVPLTADWYTGPYKIITDSVTIGDLVEPIQAVGINGGTIYAEGDGLKVYSGGRGFVLDSETAAIHILNGFFKVEPNKGLGKTWISDADGIMTLQIPSIYALPSPTYANTSTTNTDTNIITCVIPGNTLVSNKDKVVYDFVIGNTGGVSGDVSYKVKVNATSLPNDKTVTLNTSSDPITLRVTIERLTSSTFRHTLQYNFTTHTTSLRTVEYSTTSSFDFTTDSTLYIIGNQLSTTRAILGVEGHGVYLKAA